MASKYWNAFLEEVAEAREALQFEKNEECFFRGHSNPDYILSPGLLRDLKTRNNLITEARWEVECDLYYEFKSRARDLHNSKVDDWDILFYMQHHRVRTRLLDWTESLGVAIYFALYDYSKYAKNKTAPPCVWMMNPYTLNETFHDGRDLWDPEFLAQYDNDEGFSYGDLLIGCYSDEEGKMFYWDEPIALYPLRKSNRLTSQAGYFTIHGNNIQPIEQLVGHRNFLRKIILTQNCIPDAVQFLNDAAINHFTMFPDLDGLAKFLNEKYF